MTIQSKTFLILTLSALLAGCGGGSAGENTGTGGDTGTGGGSNPSAKVTISGTVTYDLVPAKSNHDGLDYDAIRQEKAKWVEVQAIDEQGATRQTTTTDENGRYTLSDLPASTSIKIRVLAKMYKTGTPGWDVKVVDNTNSEALYASEGQLASTGTTNSIRDLNMVSGWTGSSYASTRPAAPFAILDSIESAMKTVLGADGQAVFPPLQVNWSKNNKALNGTISDGEIGTSYYTNSKLFILGDADSDTDEYDDHIITHEWGHYYEDKFSRSDSIGGSHSNGDILDIRVAFGEGWGNAFSAIALNNPIYFDTSGTNQSDGWFMDIENEFHYNPGWFSESSVQRIIYDLWDSNNDTENNDTLTLGFGPIHAVMRAAQKNTEAFTSLFTFIHAMKSENTGDADAIDAIVASENIASITDIYGLGRSNSAAQYPYHDLPSSSEINVTLSDSNGSYNKLSNRQYVKFTIGTSGNYTIKAQQTNGSTSDPDFYLYGGTPLALKHASDVFGAGSEEATLSLIAGKYILDISDYNNTAATELNITVTSE